MNLGIHGRRALVTGAGRGLGRSIATCLAREGVVIAGVSRTQADLESLAAELGPERGHVTIRSDLTATGAPTALLMELGARGFNPIDIVVHNLGGTLGISDPFCSLADWQRVYRANLEVALELNLQLVPEMQRRRWGRVVHIASIAAMENHGPVTYCAMKAALVAYTRSFGGVVAPDGVVMSALLPGAVFTEGGYWDDASRERPEHVHKFLTERQRIGRFGRPEEIGHWATYLCSELASFGTGTIVPVDGGQGRGYFGQ